MFTKELVIYFCTLIFVSNFSKERYEEYFVESFIDIDFYKIFKPMSEEEIK